ncbi:hypothetical protein BB558_005916 [Smittium angustum]|uniref:tRNA ligase n=1 Tax=Smittium angustum TaxID=133377 RepID=A0A2U1IZC5_SMIAN|nr:hypothetical protein BB558_005916 [Smittium angustum]
MNLQDIPIVEITKAEKDQINALVNNLEQSSIGSRKNRESFKTVNEFKNIEISSWKTAESLYFKKSANLFTLARGLFTRPDDEANKHRIQLRGYDKFFNVNELEKTKWSNIVSNTTGPYELTVKENGCIIFVSAINENEIVISSKHSIITEHARIGSEWLNRHLQTVQKSEADFAQFLFKHNITAVFELCDDSFEEHILEYKPEDSGLYMHGINRNTAQLHTWSSSHVKLVADYFGFYSVKYLVYNDIESLKKFTDEIGEKKEFEGRPIEGFVVRTKEKDSNNQFMFKIKYDDPYLMYREWREVSKRIIGTGNYKVRYPLTKKYEVWFKHELRKDFEFYSQITKNHNIVHTRNRFLEYYNRLKNNDGDIKIDETIPLFKNKVLIITIATIACGKTTVSSALSKLFDFGHVQNDNVTAKKNPRVVFHNQINTEMIRKDFVIADRNNHIPMLRKTLCEYINESYPGCTIVALNWGRESIDENDLYRVAVNRVERRGENHQSLTPNRTDNFRGVVRRFLKEFVPLNLESDSDSMIDHVIDMDPLADSEENLKVAVSKLCALFPDIIQHPSEENIQEALGHAFSQKTTVVKNVSSSSSKKVEKWRVPRYYGLLVENDIIEKVKTAVAETFIDSEEKVIKDLSNTNIRSKTQNGKDIKNAKISTNMFSALSEDPISDTEDNKNLNIGLKKSKILGKTSIINDSYKSVPKILFSGNIISQSEALKKVSSLLVKLNDPRSDFVIPDHHITLVHKNSPGGELFSKYQEFDQAMKKLGIDVHVNCEADYLVVADGILGLRVSSMVLDTSNVKSTESDSKNNAHHTEGLNFGLIMRNGKTHYTNENNKHLEMVHSGEDISGGYLDKTLQLASINPIPHITLAHRKNREPRETNDLMLSLFGKKNSRYPVIPASGEGYWNVAVPVAIKFRTVLKGLFK